VTDAPFSAGPSGLSRLFDRLSQSYTSWRNAKISNPKFQEWASRFPLTRRTSRRSAEEVYDLVSGFVYSQTLLACVEFDLLNAAQREAIDPVSLAHAKGLDADRLGMLCQAGTALELLTRQRDGRYGLGRLGAAVIGVPGLELMIRHHRMFYRDLADPDALMKDEVETQLSQYWPYVGGNKTHDLAPDVAKTYSELMATSQQLVATQTLRAVSLRGVSHLVDVGGGTGAFLTAVAAQYSAPHLTVFDLPSVAEEARRSLAQAGLAERIQVAGGSFLDDPLPAGADAVSLIRVLYDHDDSTVRPLLKAVFEALPKGGLLLISEPMSGGAKPTKAGDAYFGFYTMAMTTGRPRSAARHAELLSEAGFSGIRHHATDTAFVTNVLTAQK
jgi:demethylspheroidene O-methyltransferase